MDVEPAAFLVTRPSILRYGAFTNTSIPSYTKPIYKDHGVSSDILHGN